MMNLVECKTIKIQFLPPKEEATAPNTILPRNRAQWEEPDPRSQGRAAKELSEQNIDRGKTLQSIRNGAVITLPSILFGFL